jgi:23S rRNA (uracil1939-C5)-methyltransferase
VTPGSAGIPPALTDVDIVRIGHKGDGETADGMYVPFTVPGDRVRVEGKGDHAKPIELLSPGPTRASPPCRHFGICGGCVLQHVEQNAYREWKREQVMLALAQRGITDIDIAPLIPVAPRTRRRAVLTGRFVHDAIMIGFQERGTHFICDMAECPCANISLASCPNTAVRRSTSRAPTMAST